MFATNFRTEGEDKLMQPSFVGMRTPNRSKPTVFSLEEVERPLRQEKTLPMLVRLVTSASAHLLRDDGEVGGRTWDLRLELFRTAAGWELL